MDLSLVPIEELVAELDKRYESSILLTHKLSPKGDVFDWHLVGNRITILGLLQIGTDKVRNDFIAEETDNFNQD